LVLAILGSDWIHYCLFALASQLIFSTYTKEAAKKSLARGYKRDGVTFDPESLKHAVELGATEDDVKKRIKQEAIEVAIKKSVERKTFDSTYFQRAVDLGANEKWLEERIEKAIELQHRKEREVKAVAEEWRLFRKAYTASNTASANGATPGAVQLSEKELAIRAAVRKCVSGDLAYRYIDPERLKRAIELGATEEEVKKRLKRQEAIDYAIEYSAERKRLHDTYLQRAVDLGANEQWLKERIQKAIEIQKEKEEKEREKAYVEIKETVGLLEDPNTVKGEHPHSLFPFCLCRVVNSILPPVLRCGGRSSNKNTRPCLQARVL
jgi:folate-binding Fe-S cluster repair protein YgfZ